MKRLLLLLVVLPFIYFSQNKSDEFDIYIKQVMAKDSIPGVTFLVAKQGKILKAASYGFANLEWHIPTTMETVYELASISKPITANAIMLLVEEGKLHLDSTINHYLTDVPVSHSKIKLRNLLNHTSGIPEDHFNYQKLVAPSPLRYTTKEQLEDLYKAKLLFEPGEKYKYSNAAFFMLATIVEKFSGMTYQKFVQTRIFNVAGMSTARFTNVDAIIPNHSQGYTLRRGKWAKFSLGEVLQALDNNGFGAGMATATDIQHFFEALQSGKILKPATFALMQVASVLNDGSPVVYNEKASPCGISWFLQAKDFEGKKCISHSGHTGTYAVYFVEKDLSIIYFTNLGEGYKSIMGDKGAGIQNKGTKLAQMAVKEFW